MTRTIIAVAVAAFAAGTLFIPAAQACISCNYSPEVVNSPAKASKAKRAPKAAQKARPAKKRIAKTPVPAQPAPSKEAEAPKVAEPTEETVRVDTPAEVAPSGSATAALNQQAARSTEPAPEPEVGCKRYSAQAGTTVTVPCD